MADLFADYVARIYQNETGTETLYPVSGLSTQVVPSNVQKKYGTYSYRFPSTPGTTGWFNYGGTSVDETGTAVAGDGQFTVEAWVRPDGVSGNQSIFGFTTSSGGALGLGMTGAQLYVSAGGSAASLPAGTLAATAWAHVAWERNLAGLNRVFVDGVLTLSFTHSASVVGSKLHIGSIGGASSTTYPGTTDFAGYMDDIRFTDGVNRYQSDFTLPGALDQTPKARADGVGSAPSSASALGVSGRAPSGAVGSSTNFSAQNIFGGRARSGVGASVSTSPAAAEPGFYTSVGLNVTAALAVAAPLSAQRVLPVQLMSSAAMTAYLSNRLYTDAELPSSISVAAPVVTTAILQAALLSGITMRAALPGAAEAVEAWAVNMTNGASTKYEGFNFNSFGKLGAQYLGAKQDGIYLLSGDADGDAPIAASVAFGKHDFGSRALKRMITTYFGVSTTGDVYLKVTTGAGDEYLYKARQSNDYLRAQRVDVGRGLEANYFTFELFNSDGADFELASADFLAADVMHRRI